MATDPEPDIEELIHGLPETTEVLALRAVSAAQSGDADRAESCLRQAIDEHPSTTLRVTLARVLMHQNRHKEAMTEMVGVLRGQPENPAALAVLAECLLECGEIDRGRKMISKARSAGASPDELAALRRRLGELTGESSVHTDETRRAVVSDGPQPGQPRGTPKSESTDRKRHRTLMGRPNASPFAVGDPGGATSKAENKDESKPQRLPPPPLQSGTFANLDTYDIEGEPDDDLDVTVSGELRVSDELPSVPAEAVGEPIQESDEFAAPDEHTHAVAIRDSDLAGPDDKTEHVTLSDDDIPTEVVDSELIRKELETVQELGDLPSVEYDAGYAEEARRHKDDAPHDPPSDLNDLPSFDADDEGLPTKDDPFPPTREERRPDSAHESDVIAEQLPGLDPAILFDDSVESRPGPGGGQQRNKPRFDVPPRPGQSNARPQGGQQPDRSVPSPQQGSPQPRGDAMGQRTSFPSQQRPPNASSAGGQRSGGAANQRPSGPSPGQQQSPNQQPPPNQQAPPNQPSRPNQQGGSASSGGPSQPGPSGPQPSVGSGMQLEGNSVPLDARWSGDQPKNESTAVTAEPKRSGASSSVRMLTRRKWPFVLVILIAVALLAFLGLTFASGKTLNDSLASAITAAKDARKPDTHEGYLQAEKKLLDATEMKSFMGAGFDRFIEDNIPIPGLNASTLRRSAYAELAAVSGQLEYRFETLESHNAPARVETARTEAADRPMTVVAEAFVELTRNQPHEALALLDKGYQTHPDDSRIQEAKVWALLDLGRTADAANAVETLRSTPQLSIRQRYLVARVDAARGDYEDAAKAFAEIFADSPDHVDSRIARSYTLRGGEEDLAKAKNVLDTVLVKKSRKTTRYQKAKATSAYGSVYLAAGEEERAEKRFIEAISKMPRRSDLYLPLLDFYFDEGRTDDAKKYIEKAREEDAFSPQVALFEARLRILGSEPEKAIQILDDLEYQSPAKTLLLGFALLDDHQLKRAVETLKPAKGTTGATEATSLYYVARGLWKEEAVEDSIYQLDRIKSKNGDNAVVHWASARANVIGADSTSSKEKRRERLKMARSDLKRAIELDPTFAPYRFALCEVYMRQLAEEQAESACLKGRALAPGYAPGMVSTAHLRLMQGKFEEAHEISEQAAKLRPADPVVGLVSARVAIEQRRLDEAEQHINKWLAKSKDQFELSLLSGRLEFMRENYTKAAGYLKQAFELRPGDGEASIYYGHTLVRLGQHERAEEILKDNLSHPTWAGYAWAVLGEVRRKQRDWRNVEENFGKAERLYEDQPIPDRYWSHLYAQWALAMKARYRKWRHGKVRAKLRAARRKGDPDDPELNMVWGRYYLEKRNPEYEKATEALEKVVEQAPYRCDAIEALQRLYKRDEAEEKAKEMESLREKNCASPEEKEE